MTTNGVHVTVLLSGVAEYERLEPARWIMDTVTVTGDTTEMTIDMKVINCESNIPKMTFARTATSVTVTRDSRASPPVTGTYDLNYNGHTLTNIAVDIEAEDLKARLETIPGIGQVKVTRSGSCSAYSWDVEFVEGAPGDHDNMTVSKVHL
jgi:hypothetical protein